MPGSSKQRRNLTAFAEFEEFRKPIIGWDLDLNVKIWTTEVPLAGFSFVLDFHRKFELQILINYSSLSSSMVLSVLQVRTVTLHIPIQYNSSFEARFNPTHNLQMFNLHCMGTQLSYLYNTLYSLWPLWWKAPLRFRLFSGPSRGTFCVGWCWIFFSCFEPYDPALLFVVASKLFLSSMNGICCTGTCKCQIQSSTVCSM